MDSQIDGYINRWIDRQLDGQMDRQMNIWMDGQMYGRIDKIDGQIRQMDSQIDGYINKQMDKNIDICKEYSYITKGSYFDSNILTDWKIQTITKLQQFENWRY